MGIYRAEQEVLFQNNHFIKTHLDSFRGKATVRRLWNRKGQAVKKWRSRAWSIDPKKTKITIIKEASNIIVSEENLELADLDLEELISSLYFPIAKSKQLAELCNLGAGALLDMEQTETPWMHLLT
jgi:hypothetical protein